MQLTGEEVEEAFNRVASDQQPGEPLDFAEIANLLNERLQHSLVGRIAA